MFLKRNSIPTSYSLFELKYFKHLRAAWVDRDNVVGITTRYRPDGLGIEFRCGRYFPYPSNLALGPTQPPIQRVPGLFLWGKAAGA